MEDGAQEARHNGTERGRAVRTLAEYHSESPADFGCHTEAVSILVEAGPLKGYDVRDFIEEIEACTGGDAAKCRPAI